MLDAAILVVARLCADWPAEPTDAQASFAEAEQTAPNAVEPLLANARLLAARGDLEGALAKIDRALTAQPKSAEALLAKAEILRGKGDCHWRSGGARPVDHATSPATCRPGSIAPGC